MVLAVAVAGYILEHQRFRFPLIESAPFKINAEFSTAQAVAPAQGQTVRVSGVQIGDIGGVKLNDGVAVVTLDIDQRYKHLIHSDATALLRPRTGLKDMFVELNPGSKAAPEVKQGFTIPVANTAPDVNVDEILSSLDADTRAYLNLLVNGAGQGLKDGGGNELAQVLERFEPTHRDLARVSHALAQRGDQPPTADQLAGPAQHRAGRRAGSDQSARRLERKRVQRVRLRGSERQPGGGRPAGHAAPDDRHARQGAGVRAAARPDGDAPAAGGPGAAGSQRGADRPGQAGHADHPRSGAPVREVARTPWSRTSLPPRRTWRRPRPA